MSNGGLAEVAVVASPEKNGLSPRAPMTPPAGSVGKDAVGARDGPGPTHPGE